MKAAEQYFQLVLFLSRYFAKRNLPSLVFSFSILIAFWSKSAKGFKEARLISFFFFFCRGVYILKSKFRMEDMLRLLSYFTKVIKCDQSFV